MIYPNISLEEWLKLHPELSLQSKDCDACGKAMLTTIPFVNKDYYGLEAPMCSCGKNRFTCSTGVTKTKSAYDDWIDTLSVHL